MRNDLEAIKARVDAASPGPWEIIGGGEYVTGASIPVAPDDGGVTTADAEFIAHARTDVPALVAEVELLRESLETSVRLGEKWRNRAIALEENL